MTEKSDSKWLSLATNSILGQAPSTVFYIFGFFTMKSMKSMKSMKIMKGRTHD